VAVVRDATHLPSGYAESWAERRRRAFVADSVALAAYVIDSLRSMRAEIAPSPRDERRLLRLARAGRCGDCGDFLTLRDERRNAWRDGGRRCGRCYERGISAEFARNYPDHPRAR
jgi:hypothetical protein